MNTVASKVVITGAFFLLIFLLGFLLSRLGKPYSLILFNLHKLIAVGAVVFLGVTIYNIQRAVGLAPLQVAAIVFAGLCFIVTIIAGGLLSIDRPMPAVLGVIHRFAPYLTLLSTAATLYLLLGRKN